MKRTPESPEDTPRPVVEKRGTTAMRRRFWKVSFPAKAQEAKATIH